MSEAKTITFTYEGKEYTLEFDRKTVKLMERRGFNINELDAKPMTLLPQLFWGALQKHHKGITQDMTDEMLDNIRQRDELFNKLSEMYAAPFNTLFSDEGNVSWEPSW